MKHFLPDGTVIPAGRQAHMPSSQRGMYSGKGDMRLRLGTVIRSYAPDDSANQSKVYWEYDIEVDPDKTVYPRVIVASLFGGTSDYLRYTLRIGKPGEVTLKTGSYVLLGCIDGDQTRAFVIAGAPKSGIDPTLKGTALAFEFNGLNAIVDDDGAMTVTCKLATDTGGKPRGDVGTAKVKFTKEGSVVLTTGDGETVTIDKVNGTVAIESSGTVFIKAPNVQVVGNLAVAGNIDAASVTMGLQVPDASGFSALNAASETTGGSGGETGSPVGSPIGGPALQVSPAYQLTLNTLLQTLTVLLTAISALGAAGGGDPLLTAPATKAALAALAAPAAATLASVAAHMATLAPGNAFSQKV